MSRLGKAFAMAVYNLRPVRETLHTLETLSRELMTAVRNKIETDALKGVQILGSAMASEAQPVPVRVSRQTPTVQ